MNDVLVRLSWANVQYNRTSHFFVLQGEGRFSQSEPSEQDSAGLRLTSVTLWRSWRASRRRACCGAAGVRGSGGDARVPGLSASVVIMSEGRGRQERTRPAARTSELRAQASQGSTCNPGSHAPGEAVPPSPKRSRQAPYDPVSSQRCSPSSGSPTLETVPVQRLTLCNAIIL